MKGKNIVIIGGNSGIGKSVAELAKESGANVFTYSKSQEDSNSLDVTEDFSEIAGLPEVIDGLVYCPGSINLKPFHRISISDFKSEMELNFFGAVRYFKLV